MSRVDPQVPPGCIEAILPKRPIRNPHREVTTAQIGEPLGLTDHQSWDQMQSALLEIKKRLADKLFEDTPSPFALPLK